jgi:multiple antibiotic resistance protein
VTSFFQAFVTLFVIIDPPGIVPVFLGLTRGRPARTRLRRPGALTSGAP